MLVIGLVVGLIVGFVVGLRARSLADAMKALAAMLKIQKAMDMADGAEDVENDESPTDLEEDEIDTFLSHEAGLDIHAELEVNPIMMYKIKRLKEQTRREMAFRALLADGLTEEEAVERLAAAEALGGGGGVKVGALQVLVDNGARVTPVNTGGNAAAIALNNIRRQKKNVEVYLHKQHGVDTSLEKPHTSKRVENREYELTAAEKAQETALKRVGRRSIELSGLMSRTAQYARRQLRDAQKKMVREGTAFVPRRDSMAEDRRTRTPPDTGDGMEFKDRRGGGVRMTHMLNLALELAEESGEEGEEGFFGFGEEGEEGEEGGDAAGEDDAELAA